MAEVLFRARLIREDSNIPWGFRLQGGADYKKPLTLLKVVEGSVAAKNGLHHSDILVKLAGKSAEGMTHKAAQEAIMASGNSLEIIVERAEATIQKSPPSTPTTPQKHPNKQPPVRIETMVFESSKIKEANSLHEVPPPTIEEPTEVDVEPSPQQIIPVEHETSENIPSNSTTEEIVSDITTHVEAFVKDPAEFQVNRRHRPGAKRSDIKSATITRDDETSPEQSSSESAESLDADTPDYMDTYTQPKVPEEKLLSTGDDNWGTVGARSSRSPVPAGGEAWRRDYSEYEEVTSSSNSADGGELVHNPEGLELSEGYMLEGDIRANHHEVYSTTSATIVREITTLEQPDSRVSIDQGTADEHVNYPWKPSHEGGSWSDDERLEEDSHIASHVPGSKRNDISYGDLEAGFAGGGEVDGRLPPQYVAHDDGHIGGDEEARFKEEAKVSPSLTFVGRRIAPPHLNDNPTGSETSTNQGPSPHISVTPSSPPSGLTVLPLSLLQKQLRELTETNTTTTDNLQKASPHPHPSTHNLPYDLSQLSQEMSDIKLEALRLMSNNAYHSPRLEDIHFSTGGPELVDIPMPAVKEMVEDLNRRLEAIAAQQPKIAQPPTAQELGISYIKQRRKEIEDEEDPEKEIFIDMPPADISLDSYGHRYLGNTEGLATNNYQKLYDASSPAHSPNYSSLGYRNSGSPYQERGSSPRNQRRVHFADPPEQSVIEIESRSRRRRRKDKDKDRSSTGPKFASVEDSRNIDPPVAPQLQDNFDANMYSLPQSSSSIASSSMSSATDVLSYSTSSVPVMVERPAARLDHYPSSSSPSLDLPTSYAGSTSGVSSSLPVTGHPGQFSVSITHKKSDQTTPTRLAFTLPSGQPGQPTHFRYTMSGSSPGGGARTPSPQQLSRGSDAGLTYSLPPRYEDSVRNQQQRSFDDYYLMRRPNASSQYQPRAMSPQPYRQASPIHVNNMAGSSSSPRSSPVYTQTHTGYINPIKGTPASLEDTTQSKSFRALEAHYTDGSYDDESSRVQILGTPQQVLQPAAVGRPFNQVQEPRTFTPPPPLGAVPGPPPVGSHEMAGAAIGPGLFALFDSSFTDKFVQWQQSPRSHFESETYKLVHEMEGDKNPGAGPQHHY